MAQFLILLAAFLIRISTAAFSGGFSSDTACFAAWADRIYALGPSGFYSPDVFTDYPPGYMYLLYPIGFLVSKTGIPYLGSLHLILLPDSCFTKRQRRSFLPPMPSFSLPCTCSIRQ